MAKYTPRCVLMVYIFIIRNREAFDKANNFIFCCN